MQVVVYHDMAVYLRNAELVTERVRVFYHHLLHLAVEEWLYEVKSFLYRDFSILVG